MRMIRAAYYKPKEPMRIIEIEDTLLEYQGLVGGLIETVRLSRELILVCNEEGRLKALERNRMGIVGPFVVVGEDGEEFRPLTDTEIEVLRRILK